MTGNSFSDTVFSVYRADGPGFGGLAFLGCTSYGGSVSFNVETGRTYYLQAGDVFSGGGNLQLNLQEAPPPLNDNFANATPIAALPFSDTVDTVGATREPGEPTSSCALFYQPSGSIWYTFSPSQSGSVSASVSQLFVSTAVAVYTGNSLTGLTELGCRVFGDMLTFRAEANTTYYFQASGLFGQGGLLEFRLEVTPPPVASFSFYPSDPSVFDTIQFYNNSYDPGQVGFQVETWDFGDGATASGCCPTHQYAADGDYTVQLGVTTFDGRSASTSQTVSVGTHDVAITKFSVPKAASAGQTRQISVGLNSKRYPENVQVQLYKSVPGGFQLVGTLTQFVPLRPANRTAKFNFSYTFTGDDARVGKVTFKAVTYIEGARDALPADNEAVAKPTKVNR
jgi:PKD repeat protein